MENNIKIECENGENDYTHYMPIQTGLVKIQSQNPQKGRQSSSEKNNLVFKGVCKQTRIRRQVLIREGLSTFCKKYFLQLTPQQFDDVVQKGLLTKELDQRNGVYIEFIAAVVYYLYSDYLGLHNTKEFCKCNGLKSKLFHQKYKLCAKFLKKVNTNSINSNDTSSEEGKYQTKIQEQSTPVEPKQLVERKRAFRISPDDLTSVQAIDVIFDTFFKSQYYQLRRRQVIEKIAEKYDSTSPAILEAMHWTDRKINKLYYTVLYYLRQCGAKDIAFYVYKEVLFEKLGLILKKEEYVATAKLFKRLNKQPEFNITSNVNINKVDLPEAKVQMNY